MISDQEHLREWEELIDAADKTNIPMQFIGRIFVYLEDNPEPETINITKLKQDHDLEHLENEVNNILKTRRVRALDFALDVDAVATAAQEHTEKILHKIK